jgi:DNA ligase-1
MKGFADLYEQLDSTTSTNKKVEYLISYFDSSDREDAAWATYFLSGRRFDRSVSTTQLREWTYDLAEVPEWLFEECYIKVGDLAETIALLLDDTGDQTGDPAPLHVWACDKLPKLDNASEHRQRELITGWWRSLDRMGVFMLNKLMMGGMRVGVSSGLVTRALSEFSGVDRPTIQHRLTGDWQPSSEFFERLISEETTDADTSRPYPYFLATPLEQKSDPLETEDPQDWLVEWKWDGIRAQLVRRDGESYLWSRGQELITDTYPEIRDAGQVLGDDMVLDGELLAWRDGEPLPFSKLQNRIGRSQPGRRIRREVPVVLMTYDIMEWQGEDLRDEPLERRRELLETVCEDAPDPIRLSPLVERDTWDDYAELRDEARDRKVEGLMLKRLGSPYRSGRVRGDWWKWKVDPLTIDAVMIYAKAGHGWRADLYTDLTFAVWDDDELVPICKAYSGLTDEEIEQLDGWIKDHTTERFGPVRSVEPAHVFEIAFAGLAPSNRHKSGIALRFPRISRWRKNLSIEDADTLDEVEELLDAHHEVPETDEPEQQSLF